MQELAQLASSPRRMRLANEVAVLRFLHQFGALSRADLARMLNLNRSSSGHIITGLAASGLVREVTSDQFPRMGQPRAGRPGIMLELVPDAAFFLGVEIGVKHISTVELNLAAKVVTKQIEPHDGLTAGLGKTLVKAVDLALQSVPQSRWSRCEGFGVSIPAQMGRNGFVRLAPLLEWKQFQPAEVVKNALPISVPVLAENEANAFAIGAAYGHDVLRSGVTLFLVIESGVGGGILIDGKLFRGANGLAGEIGHLKVSGSNGGERTLEEAIGLEAVLSEYRKVNGNNGLTLAEFLVDVQERVPSAVTVAEDWSRILAFGLVQACRIIDADRVVLGGSVAAIYPLVAARVTAHIRRIQETSFPLPSISLNDDAAFGSAFGAACMMHQRYLSLQGERQAEDILPA